MFIIRLAAEALSITETEQSLAKLTESSSDTSPEKMDFIPETKPHRRDKTTSRPISKLLNRKRTCSEISNHELDDSDPIDLFPSHENSKSMRTSNGFRPSEQDTTPINNISSINNNGNGGSILYDLLSGQEKVQNIYKRSRLVLLTLGHSRKSKSFSAYGKTTSNGSILPKSSASRRRKSSRPAKRDLDPSTNGHRTTPAKSNGDPSNHIAHENGTFNQKCSSELAGLAPSSNDLNSDAFQSFIAAARLLKLNEILTNRLAPLQAGKPADYSDEPLDLSSTKPCLPKRRQSCSKTLQSEDSNGALGRNMTRHNSVTLPIKSHDSYRSLKMTNPAESGQTQPIPNGSNLPDPSQTNKIQDLLSFILTPACMTAALSTAMAMCNSSLLKLPNPGNNLLNSPSSSSLIGNGSNPCPSLLSPSDSSNSMPVQNPDLDTSHYPDLKFLNPCLLKNLNDDLFPFNLFSQVSAALAQQNMHPVPKSHNGSSTLNNPLQRMPQPNPTGNGVSTTKIPRENPTQSSNSKHRRSKPHREIDEALSLATVRNRPKHDSRLHSSLTANHSSTNRITPMSPPRPGDFLTFRLNKWLERLVLMAKHPAESLKQAGRLNPALSVTLRQQLKQLLQSLVLCLTDRPIDERWELLLGAWHRLLLILFVEDSDPNVMRELRVVYSSEFYSIDSDLSQFIQDLDQFKRSCFDLKFSRSTYQLIRFGLLLLGDRPESALRTLLRQWEHIILDSELVGSNYSDLSDNPKSKSHQLHQIFSKLYHFSKDSIDKLFAPFVKQPIESLLRQLMTEASH